MGVSLRRCPSLFQMIRWFSCLDRVYPSIRKAEAFCSFAGRLRRIVGVRSQLTVHPVTQPGLSLADAARRLGVSTSGIAKILARAEGK